MLQPSSSPSVWPSVAKAIVSMELAHDSMRCIGIVQKLTTSHIGTATAPGRQICCCLVRRSHPEAIDIQSRYAVHKPHRMYNNSSHASRSIFLSSSRSWLPKHPPQPPPLLQLKPRAHSPSESSSSRQPSCSMFPPSTSSACSHLNMQVFPSQT